MWTTLLLASSLSILEITLDFFFPFPFPMFSNNSPNWEGCHPQQYIFSSIPYPTKPRTVDLDYALLCPFSSCWSLGTSSFKSCFSGISLALSSFSLSCSSSSCTSHGVLTGIFSLLEGLSSSLLIGEWCKCSLVCLHQLIRKTSLYLHPRT